MFVRFATSSTRTRTAVRSWQAQASPASRPRRASGPRATDRRRPAPAGRSCLGGGVRPCDRANRPAARIDVGRCGDDGRIGQTSGQVVNGGRRVSNEVSFLLHPFYLLQYAPRAGAPVEVPVSRLTPEQLDALRQIDSPTVSNAIEHFGVRPRVEGLRRAGSCDAPFRSWGRWSATP